MIWTDEKVEELRALVLAGNSGGQTAAAMGCSRNVVIGKAARLGLTFTGKQSREVLIANGKRFAAASQAARKAKALAGRNAAPATKAKAPHPAKPAAFKVGSNGLRVYPKAPPKPLRQAASEHPGLCTIHTLTATSCRWPIGDPSADMTYCGATALDGKPYCGTHHLVCYAGLPPKKARAA